MSDLLLNTATGDLVISNGDLQIAIADTAIRQNIAQRLQLFLGEWFLDTTQGVPYLQYILIKNPDLDLVQATLTNVVQQTPGVLEVTSVNFDFDAGSRSLTMTFDGISTTGEFSVQAQVGV